MKLFSLLVVILLWKVFMIRDFAARVSSVSYYVQILEKLFGRVSYFTGYLGFCLTIFLGSSLLSWIDLMLGPTLFRLVFEIVVLFFVLSSLSVCEFNLIHPKTFPETIEESLLAKLPKSIWQINYQWVAPLFWYITSGVFGLTLYWIITYVQQSRASKWQTLAHLWLEILAWIPARILAFSYAVAGNFSKGIKVLTEYLVTGILYNTFIVQRAALASLSLEKDQDIFLQCTRLQRDTNILLLAIYALLVILSWLI